MQENNQALDCCFYFQLYMMSLFTYILNMVISGTQLSGLEHRSPTHLYSSPLFSANQKKIGVKVGGHKERGLKMTYLTL